PRPPVGPGARAFARPGPGAPPVPLAFGSRYSILLPFQGRGLVILSRCGSRRRGRLLAVHEPPPARFVHVRFSNRPSGSSAFRLSTTPVSMSLTGSRFSSDSAPRPFHHGDSKTRWNTLLGGLAISMTAGPSGQTISPHPTSREGHHSTVRWNSGFSPIWFDPA